MWQAIARVLPHLPEGPGAADGLRLEWGSPCRAPLFRRGDTCASEPGRSPRLGSGVCCCSSSSPCSTASRRAQEIYTQLDQLERAPPRGRHASCGGCAPTSTCRASSSATTCSTPRASTPPEYRQRLAEFRPTNMATLDELRALAAIGDEDQSRRQPAGQARRVLAKLRSAVRLDARRRRSSQSALFLRARSAAAARGGAGDRRRRSRSSTTRTWPRSAPR